MNDSLNRIIVASAMRCGSTTLVQVIRELAGGFGHTRSVFVQPHGATAAETLNCMGEALAGVLKKTPLQRVFFKSHSLTAGLAARWIAGTELRLIVPYRPIEGSIISRILYTRRRETTDSLGSKSDPHSEAQQFCRNNASLTDDEFVNKFISECQLVAHYAADWLKHNAWMPDHEQILYVPMRDFGSPDLAERIAMFAGIEKARVDAGRELLKLENSIASQPPGHITTGDFTIQLTDDNRRFLSHYDQMASVRLRQDYSV